MVWWESDWFKFSDNYKSLKDVQSVGLLVTTIMFLTAFYLLFPAILIASMVNPTPKVNVLPPEEFEGQIVGPQGENITNRLSISPNEARVYKQSVHDTPNSHSEMKMESSMYVKYGDEAKEREALKEFVGKAEFEVPAVKAASESLAQ